MKYLTHSSSKYNVISFRNGIIAFCTICLLWLFGCQQPVDPYEGKEIIARYDDIPLTREEMDYFLPQWENPADSIRLAQVFIEEWMKAQSISEKAKEMIRELDEEVVYKRNDFERRLYEYKYAQYLVANELDTLISEKEIRNYYKNQPDKFISQSTYYAYFFVKATEKMPGRELSWLQDNKIASIQQLRKWAKGTAVEVKLDSTYLTSTSMESVLEGSRLNKKYLRKNNVYRYQQKEKETTYFVAFKLLGEVKEGELMPLSMCRETIKAMLLNQRKNRLIENAKVDVYKDAKANGKVEMEGKSGQ